MKLHTNLIAFQSEKKIEKASSCTTHPRLPSFSVTEMIGPLLPTISRQARFLQIRKFSPPPTSLARVAEELIRVRIEIHRGGKRGREGKLNTGTGGERTPSWKLRNMLSASAYIRLLLMREKCSPVER